VKINVPIELTHLQRNDLKIKLDGKHSKKLLSRQEVRTMCYGLFDGMLEAELAVSEPPASGKTADVVSIYEHPFYQIAPEDQEYLEKKLKGKPAAYAQSFVYGFNKARTRKK